MNRFGLVCFLVHVLFGSLLIAQTENPPDEPAEKQPPALIKGKIVDQDGAEVAGASVFLSMTAMSDSGNDWIKMFAVNVTADDNGEFEFEVQDSPPENWELYLDVAVHSKVHYIKQFRFFDDKLWQQTVDLESLAISTGVRVVGQLADPEGGVDLDGPVINIQARLPDGHLFYRYLNCDAEGKFDCVVPADSKLVLSIGAQNFACSKSKHHVTASELDDGERIPKFDLGKLRLKRGVSVVGTAKRLDGSPAAGIVIGIIEGDERSGEDSAEHVSSAKTDADGNFRLPPHLGKCTLLALQACRSRAVANGDTKMLESDGEVPYFNPVDVDLEGKGPEVTVKMVEAGAITISGTVFDVKGKPMVGQPVIYSWVTRFGVLNQEKTKTDVDGKYSFPFGKGRKLSMRLYNDELTNNGFDFFITKDAAFILEDLFPTQPSGLVDDLEFNEIEDDVDGLDWKVRSTGPRGGPSLFDRAADILSWWLYGDQ
ncbi:hypothetical protein [Mariniblastus fucicola]|uniref:Nickel uptake substrate-specific transmembrane region n=1 Tax=Mariniblastus fucicola TaxID=980251 RepID=A0A5B9PFU8_9BACT|nr:hypothetical protein [Mariniblastus fucicola]QEG21831.1 Nickel uptake substrate-specific transmembrane region [Mariniblastus fucicola]